MNEIVEKGKQKLAELSATQPASIDDIYQASLDGVALLGRMKMAADYARSEVRLVADLISGDVKHNEPNYGLHQNPLEPIKVSNYSFSNPYVFQIGGYYLPVTTYPSPSKTWTKVEDKLVDGTPVMEITTEDFPTCTLEIKCATLPDIATGTVNSIPMPRPEMSFWDIEGGKIAPFEYAINQISTGMPVPINNKYFSAHNWKWAIVTPVSYRFREDGSGIVEITLDLTIVNDKAGILVSKPEVSISSMGDAPVE